MTTRNDDTPLTNGIDEAATLAAIERCRKITWQQDSSRLGSQVALMREYLRRSAVIAETLGEEKSWRWDDYTIRLLLPLSVRCSLPAYVFLDKEPRYERPGVDPLEDKIIALNNDMSESRFNTGLYGRTVCWWYIRWASVKNHRSLVSMRLLDPYEPLIIFFERGGWFQREQGYVDLNGANVTLRTYQSLPPLSLDPAALDALDTFAHYPDCKSGSSAERLSTFVDMKNEQTSA